MCEERRIRLAKGCLIVTAAAVAVSLSALFVAALLAGCTKDAVHVEMRAPDVVFPEGAFGKGMFEIKNGTMPLMTLGLGTVLGILAIVWVLPSPASTVARILERLLARVRARKE